MSTGAFVCVHVSHAHQSSFLLAHFVLITLKHKTRTHCIQSREQEKSEMGTATEITKKDAMATVAPYAPVTFHCRARVDLDDRLPKPCNENAFLLHPNYCQHTDLYMCIYYRLICDISYIIIPQI